MLFNRRRVSKHIGYCYLFPVCCSLSHSCTLLYAAGSSALSKWSVAEKKSTCQPGVKNKQINKAFLSPPLPPNPCCNIAGPCMCISLTCALPQHEEFGTDGWGLVPLPASAACAGQHCQCFPATEGGLQHPKGFWSNVRCRLQDKIARRGMLSVLIT